MKKNLYSNFVRATAVSLTVALSGTAVFADTYANNAILKEKSQDSVKLIKVDVKKSTIHLYISKGLKVDEANERYGDNSGFSIISKRNGKEVNLPDRVTDVAIGKIGKESVIALTLGFTPKDGAEYILVYDSEKGKLEDKSGTGNKLESFKVNLKTGTFDEIVVKSSEEVETKLEKEPEKLPMVEIVPSIEESTESTTESKPVVEIVPSVEESTESTTESKPMVEIVPSIEESTESTTESKPVVEVVPSVEESTESTTESKPVVEVVPSVEESTESKPENKPVVEMVPSVEESTESTTESKPMVEVVPSIEESTESTTESKPMVEMVPSVEEGTESTTESKPVVEEQISQEIEEVKVINEEEKSEKVEDIIKFDDVKESHWANKSISKLVSVGVIKNTDSDKFNPNESVKKSDLINIITDTLGIDKKEELALNNLNDEVLREDAMVIVAKALESINIDLDKNTSSLNNFKDKDKISKESVDYISALVNANIICGSNGKLNVEKNITKAEVAVIMDRLYDVVNK
ncbi:S-layer homology domain-containing protein [[Clostridium] colinum]|uniref:S-layer homology domain-containing protein n=1 Tax=[Clostridium] colinum TaxID=36835 RepID=UPI002024C90C|nr:S-layer homology domain-containing protein [[Clostridium] colinum]